jgi:lysophospholipase L1-like esterase
MNTTALAAGLLVLLFAAGASGGARKVQPGARLLLLGDSQSVGAASPGGQLAQLLRAAGYKVRVLAVGGKTAYYFSLSQEGRKLLMGELAQRPACVVVFLGTNELANVALGGLSFVKGQTKGHQALRDLITKSGARPLLVGPPNFRPSVTPEAGGSPLVEAMPALVPRLAAVYSAANWLDARPLTPDHAGIHFSKDAAADFARALAPAIVRKFE